jgi:hypothetical protein
MMAVHEGLKKSISELIGSELAERALSLEAEGLFELGWELEDALSVVSALERKGGAILGGDVHRHEAGRLVPTYDSWHCDRRADEPAEAFVVRSARVAQSYLQSYPLLEGQAIFVLVFEASVPEPNPNASLTREQQELE